MLKYKPIFDLVSSRSCFDVMSNLFSRTNISGNILRSIHTSGSLGMKPGIRFPYGYSYDWAWKAVIPNIDIYTHEPLPKLKTGGRGPDGRVALKHISGGLKRPHFMVSPFRGGLSNGNEEVIEEKILCIHKNWWRPERIALVARNDLKRWVYATVSMKEGDVIRSYGKVDKLIANPKEGDAYVIGCLPLGSTISQIERYPGQGAHYAIKAGSTGVLNQKYSDNSCLVKVGKRFFRLSSGCSAVFGQMSNPEHKNHRFTKFGQKKWLGIKQRSGLFQKKTGRFGRKIYAPRTTDFSKTEVKPAMATVLHNLYDIPLAIKKKGTFEKPVRFKPIPLEENEIHPKFRWCTWSRVR